jgi:GMC oxidoreductase
MVSGIGPEETLQSLNIPVLANLPGVGQNFHVRMPFRSLHFNFDSKPVEY